MSVWPWSSRISDTFKSCRIISLHWSSQEGNFCLICWIYYTSLLRIYIHNYIRVYIQDQMKPSEAMSRMMMLVLRCHRKAKMDLLASHIRLQHHQEIVSSNRINVFHCVYGWFAAKVERADRDISKATGVFSRNSNCIRHNCPMWKSFLYRWAEAKRSSLALAIQSK